MWPRLKQIVVRQVYPVKLIPTKPAAITSNSDTITDWGKSLILHVLDAVHTPPSFFHTGKFSMSPRLRQKMRLLYLNDYGNGKHAVGPLQYKGFLLRSLLAVLQSAIVLLRLTMGMSFKRHFSFFHPTPLCFFLMLLHFHRQPRVAVPRRASL